MKKLRIGLTGAHSTGKTSVLNTLKTICPDINYITEIAREFDIKVEGANRTKVQIDILRAQMVAENKYYSKGFISDRTVIDNLAYFMAIENKYRDIRTTKIYNRIVEMRLHRYDLIFYFPIEFPIVKDGFRFEDEGFQKKIDHNILLIMKKNNVAYFPVTGSVKDRVEYILNMTNKPNV